MSPLSGPAGPLQGLRIPYRENDVRIPQNKRESFYDCEVWARHWTSYTARALVMCNRSMGRRRKVSAAEPQGYKVVVAVGKNVAARRLWFITIMLPLRRRKTARGPLAAVFPLFRKLTLGIKNVSRWDLSHSQTPWVVGRKTSLAWSDGS